MLGIALISTMLGYYATTLNTISLRDRLTKLEDGDSARALKLEIVHRQNAEAQMGEALKKLEENNRQLEQATAIDEATISSIGEAVLIVHPDGKVVRANPSAGRVLGVNQEELLGEAILKNLKFTLQADEDKQLGEKELVISKSMEHRSISSEVYRIVRPDGQVVFAQMTASPLVVAGVVYGAVVVIRDVTSEVVVDKAKTEFVSIASHQLRTPLSTINWYLEMVIAGDFGELNKDQKEFISEAYGASKRMGDLINALLNASRIDMGVVAVEPQNDVDIRDVVKGVLTDLESKIVKKKIAVDVKIDETVTPMNLDVRIMDIIFLNLISNAVKYSPDGSQVTVSATKDQKHLVISVSDKGYGIPASVQDKIFSKMFRADNAVEHEPDGNGLGLYIIKSILDTIHGSISFNSKENEGTTFTVRLPRDGMQARAGAKQLSVKPDA
jgi:PAS domain S-box-containing protein